MAIDHGARRDPWTIRHPREALVDEATAAVLDEATVTLTLLRSPLELGDRLAELHMLVSLAAQIDARLPVVVAAARDQDHSWAAIAGQLGVAPATARRRYGMNDTMIETR